MALATPSEVTPTTSEASILTTPNGNGEASSSSEGFSEQIAKTRDTIAEEPTTEPVNKPSKQEAEAATSQEQPMTPPTSSTDNRKTEGTQPLSAEKPGAETSQGTSAIVSVPRSGD